MTSSARTSRIKAAFPAAGIFLFAFGLRLAYLWEIRSTEAFHLPMGDAELFDAWARDIASGNWLGNGIFFQVPLYPYFLGAVYRIFGPDLWIVRFIQILVGSFSCVLVMAAGRLFFSKAAGVTAGLLMAIYPVAVFFDGLIQKAVFGLFFMALFMFLAGKLQSALQLPESDRHDTSRPAHRPGKERTSTPPRKRATPHAPTLFWGWIAMGAAAGLFALVRENSLILLPVTLFWIWVGFTDWPPTRHMVWSLALVVGAGLILAPVAIRNKVVGGTLALTTSNFGFNLYIGNGEGASGAYKSLAWARGDWRYEAKDATDSAQKATGKSMTPMEVSRFWTRKTLAHITQRPMEWLGLIGKKWLLVLNTTDVSDTESRYAYMESSRLLRVLGFFNFGTLTTLAAFGIWATWERRGRLWILYLTLFFYAAGITLFFVFSRFRHPLSALLMVFAAAGIEKAWRLMRQGAVRPLLVGVCIAATAAWVSRIHLVSKDEMAAHTYYNLAVSLDHQKNWEKAIPLYERSLVLHPRHLLSLNNLGIALVKMGDIKGAIPHLQKAISIKPDLPDPHLNLGIALFHAGRFEESLTHFKKAAELEPNADPKIYYNIACAHARSGQPREAILALQEAIRRGYENLDGMEKDPDLASIRHLGEYRELLEGRF